MISELQYLVPVIRASKIEESIAFFEKLGFAVRFRMGDPATYAVLELGDHVLHLAQRDNVPPDAVALYLQVENVDEVYANAQAAGLDIDYPLANQPYGMREFAVLGPGTVRIAVGSEIEHE